MTIKKYQRIKLAIVFLSAIVYSQMFIYRNFIIPIALMITSALVLMLLRRKVTGVLADERDYATGGKAALLSIQIYSWVAVSAMFVLYAYRDLNPGYEPVALTLAFSTCLLLLLYSVIFRYHNRVKMTGQKWLYTIAVSFLFLLVAIFSLRLFSGEDNWICTDGEWQKHGQPDFSAPTTPCVK
jgi:uncharacterized membrane protein